jgi:hypothetical protein
MNKRFMLSVGILLMLNLTAFARPPKARVNRWWEHRADTNRNGVVDAHELKNWKKFEREHIDLNKDGVIDSKEKRLSWKHARSRVNNSFEEKYDSNHDGWLETAEVRQLLKDRYELIKTNGKAKVNTYLEEEYDANNDGILDRTEAKVMHDDLQD